MKLENWNLIANELIGMELLVNKISYFIFAASLREHYWRQAEVLQRKTDFVYEMMPILYALVKSTNGDVDAAYENINEGKITWKTKNPENPKPLTLFTRQTQELLRNDMKANGFGHNRRRSIYNNKPDDSGSDEESRKSFEKVIISETPKTPTESNEEAKDLSIHSTLSRDRYENKHILALEHYRRILEAANARVNFGNVTSLSSPHVSTFPFFMNPEDLIHYSRKYFYFPNGNV